jgi:shikimate 5-dehydrogenase
MTNFDFRPAEKPTFYFVGVTTSRSSIMKVFPRWAEHLNLGDVGFRGIDCAIHDEPQTYRRVVAFLKNDPLSLGAVVTTHKIDLLSAARDIFDELGPCAEILGEVSCISKRDGRLVGKAMDPITSGLALEAFIPQGYWSRTKAEVCLLGAGGSSLALTTYFMRFHPQEDLPSRILATNRSKPRLHSMKAIHAEVNPGIPVEYIHAPEAEGNDAVVSSLRDGSLVVNATGLGKDAPGSPLTDRAVFPGNGMAWDFNYRGDLGFLDQAEAQKDGRNLHIEDGWLYFIYGWFKAIIEVFQLDIPLKGPRFEEICRIAEDTRTARSSRA